MDDLKANKFKVGDKVQVIADNYTSAWFNVETQRVVGEIVSVDSHSSECVYLVKVEGYRGIHDNGTFKFNDRHISLIETSNQEGIKSGSGSSDYYFTKLYNPLIAQEGGGHYKDRGIQPLEYTMKNNLSFCEGNVVKYISRYKSKNGIGDLAKVIHYALLASYEEYGEQGSTELKEKVLKLLGEHE